jgi:hypothetical protein
MPNIVSAVLLPVIGAFANIACTMIELNISSAEAKKYQIVAIDRKKGHRASRSAHGEVVSNVHLWGEAESRGMEMNR